MATSIESSDVEVGFAKLQGEDFEYYMQTYSIVLGRNSKKSTVDVRARGAGEERVPRRRRPPPHPQVLLLRYARSKSTGARRRWLMVDVESGERVSAGGTARLTPNKRRRVPPNEPVIDCEHVPVDTSSSVFSSKATVPPPEEPKFSCPICMCPFTEEMSTKCGHIFCKGCIKMAISRQNKCPTCRKKVTAKELIRVFLPTTR
ncbi:hypothetical protein DY000_02011131 [Brassica cretica]|uniref:RING-type domain-containing protein n=1 Tax=Brassica cretica TaxID=69181 RepID=A0ABQ7D2M5_BRACR|nr:hypothetical protein DY000_02011131 [Brassica cretica]